MPNWCNNVARISHPEPAMIDRAIKAFDEGKFLQEFVPCPQELLDTAATFGETSTEQANKAKYGYGSWYDFNIANWGTKWDVGGENPAERHDANNITLVFESAWAPPVEAYIQLEQQGFVVEAYYYEPGMMFCGVFEDGQANDISIEQTNGDWVKDNIPRAIDEMFGIADEFYQYENEE